MGTRSCGRGPVEGFWGGSYRGGSYPSQESTEGSTKGATRKLIKPQRPQQIGMQAGNHNYGRLEPRGSLPKSGSLTGAPCRTSHTTRIPNSWKFPHLPQFVGPTGLAELKVRVLGCAKRPCCEPGRLILSRSFNMPDDCRFDHGGSK